MRQQDNRYPPIHPAEENSFGAGLFGCAGGLLLGLVGTAIIIVLLSLLSAVRSPVTTDTGEANADLRITVRENFINEFILASGGQGTTVDIMPNNQLGVGLNVPVPGFGVTVNAVSTVQLRLNGQRIEADILNTQVFGVPLPDAVTQQLEAGLLPDLNSELAEGQQQLSNAFGAGLIFSGLSSSDAALTIEAREVR